LRTPRPPTFVHGLGDEPAKLRLYQSYPDFFLCIISVNRSNR
jgi:hypothetical protein